MKNHPVQCRECRRLTADVYYREPGTGWPSVFPLCADCYEVGWARYWREQDLSECFKFDRPVYERTRRRRRGVRK